MPGPGPSPRQRRFREKRAFIACTHCRRLKKRCTGREGHHNQCQRCHATSQVCRYMNVADDISSRLSNSQSPGPNVFVEEVFPPHDEVEHIESALPTVIADDIDQHQHSQSGLARNNGASPRLTTQNFSGLPHTTPYMFNDNYSNNISYPSPLNVPATNPPLYGGQRVRSATESPQYRRRHLPQMSSLHTSMSMPDVAPPLASTLPTTDYYGDQTTTDITVSSSDLQRYYDNISLSQGFPVASTSAITSKHPPFNLANLEPNHPASNFDFYPSHVTSSTPSTSYYGQHTNGSSYDM
jgi:hypothetical protein